MKNKIKHYLKTTLRGLIRTTWGALTSYLALLSYYGFTHIPNEGGYAAVGEFLLAVATLLVVFLNVYAQGIGSFKKVR